MELTQVAHSRLIQAGWEIERFEESDFGKSAQEEFRKVELYTKERWSNGTCTLASAVAAVIGGLFYYRPLALAAPVAVGVACADFFATFTTSSLNTHIKTIKCQLHYISQLEKEVDRQCQVIQNAKRQQMTKVIESIEKQWKQFKELLPTLASDHSDATDLLVHKEQITIDLDYLKVASRGRKAPKKFTSAKIEVLEKLQAFKRDLLDSLKTTYEDANISAQQRLFQLTGE